MELPVSVRTESQVKKFGPVRFVEDGGHYAIVAEVRHDDSCKNGRNDFAITAELYRTKPDGKYRPANNRNDGDMVACGCLHKEVRQHLPELAPFLKYHLMSTDGPMHYLANTLYHAGDKDRHGKRKGEPMRWSTVVVFGKNPIQHRPGGDKFMEFLEAAAPHPGKGAFDFEVLPIEHGGVSRHGYKFGPKYTFGGFAEKWHECPFDTEDEGLQFLAALQNCNPRFVSVPTAWGEGKEPDLEAARSCAVWPDATLEQLQDKDALMARLPDLMREFKEAVESLGLVY